MKPEIIAQCIQKIETALGKGKDKYSSIQVEQIRTKLLNEPEIALTIATDWWIANANHLPTPQKIIDSVKTEAVKHREQILKEEKSRDFLADTILTRKYGSPFLKDFQYLMAYLLADDPKEPWEVIIPKCRDFADKYPGLGFDKLADDWAYEHMGIEPIDRTCPF